MWDENEIKRILCDNRHLSSGELVQKLVQGVDDYMGSAEQTDDITIVVLRVSPKQ
jgi:serine phosphatase RsbU (regulator of sigma subunit)